MKKNWLNLMLHFSGVVSRAKTKLVKTTGPEMILIGVWVLILELGNVVVSIPAYIFIAPTALGGANPEAVRTYRLRRVVSISVLASVIGIWIIKILFVGAIGVGSLGFFSQKAKADSVSWDFNNPVAYVYDATKIQIVDGMAILKAQTASVISGVISEIAQPVSLPPVSGTVPSTANTDVSVSANTNTSVTTETANVNANINNSTGAPSVETAALPPVSLSEPTPTAPVVPTPAPVVPPPAPTPEAPTAPVAPSGGLIMNFFEHVFAVFGTPKKALAQTLTCTATVQPTISLAPLNLQNWTGFEEVANKNGGTISYQLSIDGGLSWLYWNGSAWTDAGSQGLNEASVINSHISSLSQSSGVTSSLGVLFRAELSSDCSQDVQLMGVGITYDHIPPAPVVETQQVFNLTAPLGVTFTDVSGNVITNTQKSAYITVVGKRIAHIEVSGNVDLSTALFLGNDTASLATMTLLSQVTISKFELMIPKVLGQTEVDLCPSIPNLAGVSVNCPSSLKLSSATSSLSSSVGAYALVKLDAPDYWYVDVGLNVAIALGGGARVPAVEPVAPDLSCKVLFSGTTITDSAKNFTGLLSGLLDYSVTTTIRLSGNTDTGVILRRIDDSNYLQLSLKNGTAQFTGLVNGTPVLAQNGNTAPASFALNETYHVKVQVHGTKFRAKWWKDGETEGSAWLLYADDPRFVAGLSGGGIDLASSGNSNVIYGQTSISSCLLDDSVSLQDTNTGNLIAVNHAPAISSLAGTQKADDGFVDITYTLSDAESDFSSLTAYEYSKTGAFAGEEKTITSTFTSSDADNDGILTLTSSPSGISHTLVWDIKTDLPNYAGPVYVRLTPKDSLEEGQPVESSQVTVDTKAPTLTNLHGQQNSGNNIVGIGFDVSNNPTGTVNLTSVFSYNGGLTWTSNQTLSGFDTSLQNVGSTQHQTFTWNAGVDVPNTENSDVKVKITATDSLGNTSTTISAPFSIDTKAPFGLGLLAGISSNTHEILWHWSPVASEANFHRYVLVYGTDESAVSGATSLDSSGVSFWGTLKDSDLAIMGTDRTVVIGLAKDTLYFAKVIAYDDFGHTSFSLPAEFRTKGDVLIVPPAVSVEASTSSTSVSVPSNQHITTETLTDAVGTVVTLPEPEVEVAVNSSSTTVSTGENISVSNGGGNGGGNSTGGSSGSSRIAVSNNLTNNGVAISPQGTVIPTQNSIAFSQTVLKNLTETRESSLLAKPAIAAVKTSITGSSIDFTGKGIPNTKVALFIHSDQVVVYTTTVTKDGTWNFSHNQNNIELAEGQHTIFAVTYDEGSKIKSKPSLVKTFDVRKNSAAVILSYFNLPTTILTIIILLFAVCFLFLRGKGKNNTGVV